MSETKRSVTRTRNPDGAFTVEGWRENGSVLCPRCGTEVALVEDVEAYFPATGEIEHTGGVETGWGPGTAQCCGLLIVCGYDRDYVFEEEGEEGAV